MNKQSSVPVTVPISVYDSEGFVSRIHSVTRIPRNPAFRVAGITVVSCIKA